MIPLDKKAHFLVGAVLSLALGYLLPPVYGVVAAVLAGAIKEIYDYLHPKTHTCDGNDFLATSFGGLVGGMYLIGIQ